MGLILISKFIFKFQKYLDVKEQIEMQKKLEYGLAVSKLQDSILKKERLISEKDIQVESLKNHINDLIDANIFIYYNNYIEFLKKEILHQEQIIIEQEQEVNEVKLNLLKAMKETKIISKLKENETKEFNIQEVKDEQEQLDEIISYKYNNR